MSAASLYLHKDSRGLFFHRRRRHFHQQWVRFHILAVGTQTLPSANSTWLTKLVTLRMLSGFPPVETRRVFLAHLATAVRRKQKRGIAGWQRARQVVPPVGIRHHPAELDIFHGFIGQVGDFDTGGARLAAGNERRAVQHLDGPIRKLYESKLFQPLGAMMATAWLVITWPRTIRP